MKLLEKIEELTLYAIQQDRTVKERQGLLERKDAEIGSLNSRMAALEQMMERLARQEQK